MAFLSAEEEEARVTWTESGVDCAELLVSFPRVKKEDVVLSMMSKKQSSVVIVDYNSRRLRIRTPPVERFDASWRSGALSIRAAKLSEEMWSAEDVRVTHQRIKPPSEEAAAGACEARSRRRTTKKGPGRLRRGFSWLLTTIAGMARAVLSRSSAALSRVFLKAEEAAVEAPTPPMLLLDDAVLCTVLCRSPLASLASLKCCSRRFRRVTSSPGFLLERRITRHAETLLLALGTTATLVAGGRVKLGELPAQRHSATALEFNGSIVLLGGVLEDGLSTASCLRLGVARGLRCPWSRLTPMLTPRSAHAAGILNDTIVVAGGIGRRLLLQGDPVAECEIFEKGEWRSAAPMPESTYAAASCSSEGLFFVVGGFSNNLFIFDGEKWRRGAALPECSWLGAACFLQKTLYFFGGWRPAGGEKSLSREVFAYDLDKDAWRAVEPMPVNMPFPTASPVEDGIILTSGSTVLHFTPKEAGGSLEGCWRTLLDDETPTDSALPRQSTVVAVSL